MNWKLQEQRCVQNQIWSTSSLVLPFAFSLTCGDIFRYHLPTWFHAKIIGFKQSWTRVLICPYPGVKISVFTSGLSSTLHRFFNTIIWMLQEFILLYSLFQRMLCHLLIAKRTWTYKKNWTYMKKKSYFKLFLAFLLYLFSCIRIFFVGGKKRQKVYFSLVRKTYFLPFCTISMFWARLWKAIWWWWWLCFLWLYLHAVCVALTMAASHFDPSPTCITKHPPTYPPLHPQSDHTPYNPPLIWCPVLPDPVQTNPVQCSQ